MSAFSYSAMGIVHLHMHMSLVYSSLAPLRYDAFTT